MKYLAGFKSHQITVKTEASYELIFWIQEDLVGRNEAFIFLYLLHTSVVSNCIMMLMHVSEAVLLLNLF